MRLLGGKILIIFSIFIAAAALEKARFDFYRVYRVKIENEVHLELMRQINEYPDGYQFFNNFPNRIGASEEIIVPPHKFGEWSELTEKYELNVKLQTNNLQEKIDEADMKNRRRKSLDWTGYWKLEEFRQWMRDLVQANPIDRSIFIAGISYEGRDILGLRINVGNSTGKRSIFYESIIHSAEWLGGSTTTYIIDQLLHSTDPTIIDLRNRFDWWFLPVLNVDGYEYAWNTDRTWRKTRQPQSLLCTGSDPNRNFDVDWGKSGISTNPCSDRFPGHFPFSEPEIDSFSKFLKTIPRLSIYFSFHQMGQFTMIPPGYTFDRLVNNAIYEEIGRISNEALTNSTGAVYQLGGISEFFGLVSGSSLDWVEENVQPVLSYCWELRPDSKNPNVEEWDVITPDNILPTGIEMFASTLTVIKEAVARQLLN